MPWWLALICYAGWACLALLYMAGVIVLGLLILGYRFSARQWASWQAAHRPPA